MPRDASGIYTTPAGTTAVPDTTIESAKYNANVADVAADLNAPRPIVAGGTGATSAAGALTALGAVAKAGDTMTGDLKIEKANPALYLNETTAGGVAYLAGTRLSGGTQKLRWAAYLASGDAESSGNAGSNFTLQRYTDAGVAIDNPLVISRADGRVTLGQQPLTDNHAATKKYVDAAVLGQTQNNILINGGFDVNQFVGTAGIPVVAGNVSTYFADGWKISKTGSSAFGLYTQGPSGWTPEFSNTAIINTTTAQPSLGGDLIYFTQPIEGARIARARQGGANALPISFCFRATFPQAGQILVRLADGIMTTMQDVYVTVPTAGVPMWCTGTFPAQTTGTWPTDHTVGANLQIFLGIGAMNPVAAVGMQTGISGVMLVPGNTPPPTTNLLMRPWPEQWQLCKRYYEQCGRGWTGAWSSGTTAQVFGQFEVAKRTTPTLFLSPTEAINMELMNLGGSITPAGVASIANSNPGQRGARVSLAGLVNSSAPGQGPAGLSADPFCFDARL